MSEAIQRTFENQIADQIDPYIENRLEHAKFILKPSVETIFPEITKDLALSNLDYYTLYKLQIEIEIVNMLLLYVDLFPQSINAYLRDIFSTLQLHRSKGGFEAKLQRTGIFEQHADIKNVEGTDRRRAIFGFNKNNNQQSS